FQENYFEKEIQSTLVEIAHSLSILLYQNRLKDQLERSNVLINQKNKNIIDSINYAKRIQKALLPSEDYMRQIIPEVFVLNHPKDIVSGDFYWVEKGIGKAFLSVVDCTGHGVPGAMMSILGINLLSQAVNEKNFDKPSQILNFLNVGVHLMLHTGADEDISDGMDLALISYDQKNKVIEYSGAFNPLYIIRKKELYEYKAERFSVGEKMSSGLFTDQIIQAEEGDMVYLFSDGFADQFGGENGKKYKYHNFKSLLISICQLPVEEQKEALLKEFEKWKGNYPQTDDICIVGFRIT
ncbi:MAG: serine/threonine protein phosphatase, partial [Bacteroidetes bacterium]